ncbi:MAG: malectin domain-containing carbohydrate-binding protein, partial [Planctomycetota bacterium]
ANLTPNDQAMAYAWVYVFNQTGGALDYTLALGSDDGVVVDVNGEEKWVNSVPRGSGGLGVIQDRVAVTLEPGRNLVQFKVFEGGGNWELRARFEDAAGAPVRAQRGGILVFASPVEPSAYASRSIALLSATASGVAAAVTIEVDANASYTIAETFSDRYVASDPTPAGATIGTGSIRWTNLGPAVTAVSYRLTSSKPYSRQPARNAVAGTIASGGAELAISGASVIPPPAITEVLVTPPLSSARGGCSLTAAELAGKWVDDVDDASITDERIVPREGLEFLPAFETEDTQAIAWEPVAPENEGTYYTGSPLEPGTLGKIVRVASADGFYNWNDVYYGANPEICMNVAYVYVVNETAENPLVAYLGVGSDDSILVRVNGRVVWNNPVCRGYPGFTDRFAIGLDPGKNLIAIYTYEEGGGFNMGVQFQDREGNPVRFPTTLDPTGYDPDPAKHPDHSELLATVPPLIPALSPLGFISEFLVPLYPFDRTAGTDTPPAAARAEDYATVLYDPCDVSNTFEGAYVNPSLAGISTRVRSPIACTSEVPLVLRRIAADDKAFDGEAFYGAPDNYTTSVFAFLTNETTQDQTIYMGFSSDDGGAIFLDGELVAYYGPPRGWGAANCIQNPGPQEVVVTPGTHLIQGSYVEVGGGSGIRIGLFEKAGTFVDGATVGSDWIPIDPAKFSVSATNPEHVMTVYATRAAGPVPCSGAAKVTLTFTVIAGGSANALLLEQMPANAKGSNPSKGSFDPDGKLLTFQGTVRTGDTISYDVTGARLGSGYCYATVNGDAVRGDQSFTRQTDVCVDIASKGYYINCGGPLIANDGRKRQWRADTVASPSLHLTSPNANGWQDTAASVDLTQDPFIAAKAYSAAVFQSERWNDGPIEYTFTNIPPGCYEVALLFMEICCSDGCNVDTTDPSDPNENAGGCRVFNVTVNGEYPTNDEARNVHGEDGELFSQKLAAGNANNVATHLVSYVNVTDGKIVVHIEDLGSGNPPENASIKGIAIEIASDPDLCGGPPPGRQFRRSDADDSGVVNITDGIFILNYLFLGGPAPTCLETADANDDGGVNITDGIFVLNYLFLGGPAPPAPGPDACGPDGAGSPDLGCTSYTKC